MQVADSSRRHSGTHVSECRLLLGLRALALGGHALRGAAHVVTLHNIELARATNHRATSINFTRARMHAVTCDAAGP
jgi:hypothetical protein